MMTNSGFQSSKRRVIIAEVFLNKMHHLKEDDRKDLVAMIQDAGNFKELKAYLKHLESSTAASSSIWSSFKSFFPSKEQTSEFLDEAFGKSRNTKDREFLAMLPGKVSKEPLLEQLAQDVVTEAQESFQKFMKKHLPKLYSQVLEIKRQTIHHHIEAEANDQNKSRRLSARLDLFNEIQKSQPHMDSRYVQCVTCYS